MGLSFRRREASGTRLSGGGKKLRDVDIDQDIFEWFTDRRSQGMRITGKALLVEAQCRFFAGGITAFKAVKHQYKIHTGGVPRQDVTRASQLVLLPTRTLQTST